MPRKPGDLGSPADGFVGGKFPDGRLRAGAGPGVAEMAAVAVELRARLDELEWSISQLAVEANVDRTTVHDLLAGRAYCDVTTLAKLEHAVVAQLWPGPQS